MGSAEERSSDLRWRVARTVKLSGHWVVIVGISDDKLTINDPLSGMRTWDCDFFMSQYLIQTAERPLIYAP